MEPTIRYISAVSYHSPQFPAHWGIWIPSSANPAVGKLIHVVGNPRDGFEHEIKRNHTFVGTKRMFTMLMLSEVDSKYIIDSVPGKPSVDTTAVDEIERIALSTPAPGKSLKSSDSAAVGTPSYFQSYTYQFSTHRDQKSLS